MSSERERILVPILLGLTVATGLVDAASVLGLGRVFTANMTGNVVFLGFAAGGSPGFSFIRSSSALVAFLVGAVMGGRIGLRLGDGPVSRPVTMAFGCETALLLAATGVAFGGGTDLVESPLRLYSAIVLTGVAMGIRNAVIRKLAVPDLTTTVLTMTLTGLAADSPLAGSKGPRWGRRMASILCMFAGAAAGALLLRRSVALALGLAGVVSALCTIAAWRGLTRAEAQPLAKP